MPSAGGNVFEPTLRTSVRRIAKNAVYEREAIYRMIDEAIVCHVGFVDDGRPFVIPTIPGRMGDRLIVHGSPASRMIKHLCSGEPICINITLLDGLVLARSLMHHSMNYRSVVLLGAGTEIKDDADKTFALKALTDHVMPGRWDDARQPNKQELAATAVVSFPLEEASAKVRTGPPVDEEADYELPVWARVLPLSLRTGEPIADPRLRSGISVPDYLASYNRGDGPS